VYPQHNGPAQSVSQGLMRRHMPHGDAQARRDKIVNLHTINTLCADRQHMP